MKRSIIILIALVLIISLPVFASTPEEENAPTATSEDGMFLDMTQLSEEELMAIIGNVIKDDGSSPEGAFESEDISDYEYYCRDRARDALYHRLAAEAKSKFNWSQAFFNTLMGALSGAISQIASNAVTSGVISTAIIAASVTNPVIAAALAGAGIGYLTYLVQYYFFND
jgi:hypothetical protein